MLKLWRLQALALSTGYSWDTIAASPCRVCPSQAVFTSLSLQLLNHQLHFIVNANSEPRRDEPRDEQYRPCDPYGNIEHSQHVKLRSPLILRAITLHLSDDTG